MQKCFARDPPSVFIGFPCPQIEHLLVEWSQYNGTLDNDKSDEESTDDNLTPANDPGYHLEFVRSMFSEEEIKEKFPHLLSTETVCIQDEDMLNRTIADFETKLTPYVIQSSSNSGRVSEKKTLKPKQEFPMNLLQISDNFPRFRSVPRFGCGEHKEHNQLAV